MIIIKMGGSIITNKSRYKSFRSDSCYNIIKSVKSLDTEFILIHGGGSFGHIKANKFGLPGKLNKESLLGFSEVHADMVDLNQRVISILNDLKIPSISLPPAVIYMNGEMSLSAFGYYSRLGFVPVTFGDTYVVGDKIGIISGDELAVRLSAELSPEKVIFFSDVDGVYDKNPKIHKDARLLRTLSDNATFEITETDVTGGMRAKVTAAMKIARSGSKVYMINGNFPDRVKALESSEFIGTVIG